VHARTSRFSADPARLDAGVGHLRHDAMPDLQRMPGFVGMSGLVDRASGRCLVTTAWRDEQAMREAADAVATLREGVASAMGAGEPELAEWEFASVHRRTRTPAGACTRVTWGRVGGGDVEQLRGTYVGELLPRLEEVPGFVSVTLLVDRGSGRAAIATTYDGRESMERTREMVGELREHFTRSVGMEVTEVAEFELALAHLRVPELV
jgi:heme-degrading monooxygenase HmoA